mgnify:FL=1
MNHFLSGENIGLIFPRQVATTNWSHVEITNSLVDNRVHYSNKGICLVSPLYLYPKEINQLKSDATLKVTRTPNLN